MRRILVVALAAAGLTACASEGTREAAVRECESVGITQKDPQFDTCTQAFRLSANQANLETSYRRALNPTYDNGKLAHQWHGY